MTATMQRMTAEDLFNMSEDGYCYELVQGELIKMSPPGFQHGRITFNIALSLGNHVRLNNLGTVCAAETGFKITSNPDTVRAPDVAFISLERVQQVGDTEGYWPGAPDLVVEVVSPSDVYTKVENKVYDWLTAGSKMVIIVNPQKRAMTVYRSQTEIVMLNENDTLDAGDVVPGWSIAIKDIFV